MAANGKQQYEKGTIDAAFILRRLPEERHTKTKKVRFVDLEKAFDRVTRKVIDLIM